MPLYSLALNNQDTLPEFIAYEGREVKDIEINKVNGESLQLNITVPQIADTEYQVWSKDHMEWKLIMDSVPSTKNSFIWKPVPTTNDQYSIFILYRSISTGHTVKTLIRDFAISYFSDFKVNKISGTNIETRTAQANQTELITFDCQRDDLEYQFYYNWNERGWLPLTYAYAKDNTLSWTPEKNGIYQILACIRQIGNTQNYLETTLQYSVIDQNYKYPSLRDVIIDSEQKAIIAVPSSDNLNVEYRFIAGEPNGNMKTIQKGPNSYCQWYPTQSGFYDVYVQVFEKDSNIKEDQIVRTIHIPYMKEKKYGKISIEQVTIKSTNSNNDSIPINTPVNFIVKANGGKNLQYQFLYNDGINWNLLQNYSSNPSLKKNWIPTKKGVYTFLVKVKDSSSGSYEDNAYKTVIVSDEYYQVSSEGIKIDGNLQIRYPQKLSILVDGISNPLYEFTFSNKDYGREIIQNYSPLNICSWIPKKPGKYIITARIKDKDAGSYETEYKMEVVIK